MDRRTESAIEGLDYVIKHIGTSNSYRNTLLGVAKEEIQRLAAEVERLRPREMTRQQVADVLKRHKYRGQNDWFPSSFNPQFCTYAGCNLNDPKNLVPEFEATAIAEKLLREKEANRG